MASTYYSFVDNGQTSIETRRHALSPSSFASSSNSSSSLNHYSTTSASSSLTNGGNNALQNSVNTGLLLASEHTSQNNYSSDEHQQQAAKQHKLNSSLDYQFHQLQTQPKLTTSATLHSLESRSYRPFKSNDGYLLAMKEDLAEWLNNVYSDLELDVNNFIDELNTGVVLCRHANNVTTMGRRSISSNKFLDKSTTNAPTTISGASLFTNHNNNDYPSIPVINDFNKNNISHQPQNNDSLSNLSRDTFNTVSSTETSQVTSEKAKQNTKNCIQLNNNLSSRQISPELSMCLRSQRIDWFEIDLISYKKNAKFGTFFARDNICQFINWCKSINILDCLLFETDDLVMKKNERSFILCLLEVARIGFKVGMSTPLIIQLEQEIDKEIENDAKLLAAQSKQLESISFIELNTDNNNSLSQRIMKDETVKDDSSKFDSKKSVDMRQQDEDEDELKPQVITNDLVSLHERVVQLLNMCTCPTQFPMVRIEEGKYRLGDKLVIFLRILRNHIMVRVGGGWDTLEHYLDKHDPCRYRLSLNQRPLSSANKLKSQVSLNASLNSSTSSPTNHQQQHSLSCYGYRKSSLNISRLNSGNDLLPSSISPSNTLTNSRLKPPRSPVIFNQNHSLDYRNAANSPVNASLRSARLSSSVSMNWLSTSKKD